MHNRHKYLKPSLIRSLLLATATMAYPVVAGDWVERKYFKAKYEPVDRVLSGGGQLALNGGQGKMTSMLGDNRKPLTWTTYGPTMKKMLSFRSNSWFSIPVASTQFQHIAGCEEGKKCFKELLTTKRSVFEEGLDEFASQAKAYKNPIFFRVGYEVNAAHNGYDAETFVKLYQETVKGLRARGVTNVAYQWNLDKPSGGLEKYGKWYPGDEYVDWWSLDVWNPGDFKNAVPFFKAAGKQGKPVMIVESTCRNCKGWDPWFKDFFAMIRDNPEIKGFSYINWDWTVTRWPSWGNASLDSKPDILPNYRKEMDLGLYLHGGSKAEFDEALKKKTAGSGGTPTSVWRDAQPESPATVPRWMRLEDPSWVQGRRPGYRLR